MKKLGYARVSTEEQNLQLQLDALTDYGCESIYTDKGLSGGNRQRPELLKLLSEINEGDELIVWEWDRLSRDSDFSGWLRIESENKGWVIVNLNGKEYDSEDPESYLNAGIKSVIAHYERLAINRRVKAGIKAAQNQGVHCGRKYKLNQVQLNRLLELHKQRIADNPTNLTVPRICKELGIAKSTYYNVVKDFESGLITDNKLPQN